MCNAATDGRCADWACVTPEPKVTSVQHFGEDHDEGTVNLEQNERWANTAEGRSTVLVQEDFEDINYASGDSLSPDLQLPMINNILRHSRLRRALSTMSTTSPF